MKIFKTNDGMTVKRVSRWIRINFRHITEKSNLYGYSDSGDLLYFTFNGIRYALGQFMRFDFGPSTKCPTIEDGKDIITLIGYDCTEYYKPLLLEVNNTGEAVRLYREVSE